MVQVCRSGGEGTFDLTLFMLVVVMYFTVPNESSIHYWGKISYGTQAQLVMIVGPTCTHTSCPTVTLFTQSKSNWKCRAHSCVQLSLPLPCAAVNKYKVHGACIRRANRAPLS